MNPNTKARLQIFITHVQILATRTMDINGREYADLNNAAQDLKDALDKDETVLNLN